MFVLNLKICWLELKFGMPLFPYKDHTTGLLLVNYNLSTISPGILGGLRGYNFKTDDQEYGLLSH